VGAADAGRGHRGAALETWPSRPGSRRRQLAAIMAALDRSQLGPRLVLGVRSACLARSSGPIRALPTVTSARRNASRPPRESRGPELFSVISW